MNYQKYMTSPKAFIILIFFTVFLSLFSCDNPRRQGNPKVSELDTISFTNLSKKAYDYLNQQQDICNKVYKIGTYEHWHYDQGTGKLIFSDSGVTKLIVDYEEVGSVSEVTNTFLWAWGNTSLEEQVKSEIRKVKEYGQKRGFEKLTDDYWKADQYDGWEMTAIASYLLKTKGAYRVPTNDGKLFSFMIFKNISWPDSTKIK